MTFTKEGAFHTDELSTGNANGPWLWEPLELIDNVKKGATWDDPARLVMQIFEVNDQFSTKYQKKMMEK